MAKHLTKKQREELSSRHAGTKSRRNEGTRELFYSFLIVSEGTKTEPEYFRHFTSRRSRVQVVGADRSTRKLLEEALRIRDLGTFDYKWLVFDKDDNEDFNEAIQLAEKAGFQCAWSNESFELWFCLHFIDLRASVSRRQYIDILEREIRRYVPEFTYKKGGDVMYDILRKYGSQENAVLRAQNLRLAYSGTDYASHNPCTTVDVLVDKLKK